MTFTKENFPRIAAETKAAKSLSKLLDLINTYSAQGSIPNPEFQNCKYLLNRGVVDFIIRLSGGIYENEFRAAYHAGFDFNSPLHCAGKVKKAKAKFDNQVWFEVCGEIIKLVEAVESLKNGIVKRQARSEEERADDYVPPMPTSAAAQKVNAILKEMTDGLTSQYADYLHNDFVTSVETFKPQTWEQKKKFGPSYCESILMPMVGDNWDSFSGNYANLKPNWKEILRAKAESDADFAQRMFLYKNVMKLATIIENKENFASYHICDGRINAAGFQGEILFEFADGSRFYVRNKVVAKYSVHNRPFHQFPTTFHMVTLPDGKAMPQPSEERMIEIFSGHEGKVDVST